MLDSHPLDSNAKFQQNPANMYVIVCSHYTTLVNRKPARLVEDPSEKKGLEPLLEFSPPVRGLPLRFFARAVLGIHCRLWTGAVSCSTVRASSWGGFFML